MSRWERFKDGWRTGGRGKRSSLENPRQILGRERAAPLGNGSAKADGVKVVAEKVVEKSRVRGPGKVKPEAKVKSEECKVKKENP